MMKANIHNLFSVANIIRLYIILDYNYNNRFRTFRSSENMRKHF